MKKYYLLALFIATLSLNCFSQIGVRTDNPDLSAEFDIVSPNGDKGLLIPRVELSSDLTDPSPVSNPAIGLMVFNKGSNADPGYYYWNGDGWYRIAAFAPTVGTFAQSAIQCYNTQTNITGSTQQVYINWDGVDYEDPSIFTRHASEPQYIYVNVSGVYEFSYLINVTIGGDNSTIEFQSRIKVDGTEIMRGKSHESGKGTGTFYSMSPAPVLWNLEAGQAVGVAFNLQYDANAYIQTVIGECTFSIKLIKQSE